MNKRQLLHLTAKPAVEPDEKARIRKEILELKQESLNIAVLLMLDWRFEAGFFVPPKDDERRTWAAIWNEKGYPDWMPRYADSIQAAYELEEKLPADKRNAYVYKLNWVINQYEDVSVDPRWQFTHASPADRCRTWLMVKKGV